MQSDALVVFFGKICNDLLWGIHFLCCPRSPSAVASSFGSHFPAVCYVDYALVSAGGGHEDDRFDGGL